MRERVFVTILTILLMTEMTAGCSAGSGYDPQPDKNFETVTPESESGKENKKTQPESGESGANLLETADLKKTETPYTENAEETSATRTITQEEIAAYNEKASTRTIDGMYETYVWTQYDGYWGYFQNANDNVDIISLQNLAISEAHSKYRCRGNYSGRDDFIYYEKS